MAALEDQLLEMVQRNSDLEKNLRFQYRCMDLADAYVDKLKQDLAAAEHRIAVAYLDSASIAAKHSALGKRCAMKEDFLRNSESARSYLQDQVALAQRTVQRLTAELQNAHQGKQAAQQEVQWLNMEVQAAEQGRQDAQQEVQRLTSQVQPLQEAHDAAHRVFYQAVCPASGAVCCDSGLCECSMLVPSSPDSSSHNDVAAAVECSLCSCRSILFPLWQAFRQQHSALSTAAILHFIHI